MYPSRELSIKVIKEINELVIGGLSLTIPPNSHITVVIDICGFTAKVDSYKKSDSNLSKLLDWKSIQGKDMILCLYSISLTFNASWLLVMDKS